MDLKKRKEEKPSEVFVASSGIWLRRVVYRDDDLGYIIRSKRLSFDTGSVYACYSGAIRVNLNSDVLGQVNHIIEFNGTPRAGTNYLQIETPSAYWTSGIYRRYY